MRSARRRRRSHDGRADRRRRGRRDRSGSRRSTAAIVPATSFTRSTTAGGRTIVVDEETARLLDYAQQLFELSDGKFDVTSGVLRRAWRFDGSDRVPSRKAVAALLAIVGWQKARWQVAGAHAAAGHGDRFRRHRQGIRRRSRRGPRAAAVVAMLAQLRRRSPRARAAGGGASVARRHRVADRSATRRPSTSSSSVGALATSGDARRFLVKDGKRYSHILDPTTGWPVVDAPRSVTVAAPSCTHAGMLATFALLRGRDAEAFLDAQRVKYWALR